MGYASDTLRAWRWNATEFLNRVLGRVDLSEDDDDVGDESDLAWSLRADEDIRTGKNRPLTAEEQRRYIERVSRGGR